MFKQIYEIRMMKGGETVRPNATVSIRLLIYKALRRQKNLKVYVSREGEVSEISAVRDGDYMVISVTEVSTVVIAGIAKGAASPAVIAVLIIGGLLLLLFAAYVAYRLWKRKNNTNKTGGAAEEFSAADECAAKEFSVTDKDSVGIPSEADEDCSEESSRTDKDPMEAPSVTDEDSAETANKEG